MKKGWVVLVLAVAAAAFGACNKSNTGNTGSSGDDGGDANSECPCVLDTDSGATITIACSSQVCVGGSAYYYCSAEGSLTPLGTCPPVEDDAGNFDSGCTPSCPDNSCGINDGCGSVCQCNTGLICQNNVCGNGCALMAGDYCGIDGDASTSTTCCQAGLTCQASGDAAATTCCAITGVGICTTDTDCCDYPGVHCDLTGDPDAGPDASKPTHTCIP